MNRREFLKHSSIYTLGCLIASPTKLFASEGLWVERAQVHMGSILSLSIFHENYDIANSIIDRCFKYITSLLLKISDWEKTSETSYLNNYLLLNNPCPELISLLQRAEVVKNISSSNFNILSSPLSTLWKNAFEQKSLPQAKMIEKACIEIKDSKLNISNKKIEIIGNSAIELGGIGKGFVADCAANFLSAEGIKFAKVAASGDLRFIGNTSWNVDIEHPRNKGILKTVELYGGCAISTSGDYRNCWQYQGKNYHHLIDLKTGKPSNHFISATVSAKTATEADALATAAFVMPLKESLSMLSSQPEVSAILVDKFGKIHNV